VDATGGVTYTFGQYDSGGDAFISGTTKSVTGSYTLGPNGTLNVNVPLSELGNPTIPVTDSNTLPAVIEPYAVIFAHEQAVRFTAQVDRAPNAGSFGANWAVCISQKPTTETIEDDDKRIAYSAGWHLISDTNASAGHFRYHTGNSPSHSAALDFQVAAGKTGAITYYFARSPKGGTADVYLDGALKETVSFKGSAGSTQKPEYSEAYKVSCGGLAAGAHRLEIRNMSDVVYIDRFVLESSSSNAQPASGPGNTTNQPGSIGGGLTSSINYLVPSGSQELSVVAESNLNIPLQLVLVDPSSLTLATANASNGIATISRPVAQGGVYVIKVVNLSLGPVQITTTTTPLVSR
jgi:hypothetical protein